MILLRSIIKLGSRIRIKAPRSGSDMIDEQDRGSELQMKIKNIRRKENCKEREKREKIEERME